MAQAQAKGFTSISFKHMARHGISVDPEHDEVLREDWGHKQTKWPTVLTSASGWQNGRRAADGLESGSSPTTDIETAAGYRRAANLLS